MASEAEGDRRDAACWQRLAQALAQAGDDSAALLAVAPEVTGFAAAVLWLADADGRLEQAATGGLTPAERLSLPERTAGIVAIPALLAGSDMLRPERAVRIRPDHFALVGSLTRRRNATPGYLLGMITQEGAPADATRSWTPLDTLALPLRGRDGAPGGVLLLDGPNDPDAITAATLDRCVTLAEALAAATVRGRAVLDANRTRQALEVGLVELTRQVSLAQSGDFTVQVPVTDTILGMLADVFNQMVRQMGGMLGGVRLASRSVDAHTATVRDQTAHLLAEADAQMSHIHQVSTTIGAITQSIAAMARQSADTAIAAEGAREVAAEGRDAVEDAVRGMESVRDAALRSSQRVKRLAETIQEIEGIATDVTAFARRTNLLAVNAAIEAQRAGDAGRGFTSVVQEIRALAVNSADAAQQIAGRIRDIQREAEAVVQAIEEGTERVVDQSDQILSAGATLQAVDEDSAQIAALCQTIAEAAQTEAEKILALRVAMDAILQITTATRAGTAQIAAAVVDLAQLTAPLHEQLGQFALGATEAATVGSMPPSTATA